MKKYCLLAVICLAFGAQSFSQTGSPGPKDSIGTAPAPKDNTAPALKDSTASDPKEALSSKEKDAKAKALTPAGGKALVYVVRPSSLGGLIKMTVRCDNVEIGSTKAGNFVYAMIDPGSHTLTSSAENTANLEITLEAGKTYYVKQQVLMGFVIAETNLKVLDDKDGQKDLKKCRLSKHNVASN